MKLVVDLGVRELALEFVYLVLAKQGKQLTPSQTTALGSNQAPQSNIDPERQPHVNSKFRNQTLFSISRIIEEDIFSKSQQMSCNTM